MVGRSGKAWSASAVHARRARRLAKRSLRADPAGVLRAKRLDIVDEGGRLRASLGAGEPWGSGAHLSVLGENGNSWASLGLHDNGQAYVAVSGGEKGRGVKMAAGPDGDARLLFTGEEAPLIFLSLDEEDSRDPASSLVLGDGDGRAAVAACARKSGPCVRFSDRRGEVRASLELAANGEPILNRVDEKGYPHGCTGRVYRTSGESSKIYRALIVCAFMVVCSLVGAWVAGAASAAAGLARAGPRSISFGALAAALVTVGALVALVLLLLRQRR